MLRVAIINFWHLLPHVFHKRFPFSCQGPSLLIQDCLDLCISMTGSWHLSLHTKGILRKKKFHCVWTIFWNLVFFWLGHTHSSCRHPCIKFSTRTKIQFSCCRDSLPHSKADNQKLSLDLCSFLETFVQPKLVIVWQLWVILIENCFTDTLSILSSKGSVFTGCLKSGDPPSWNQILVYH